MRQILAIIGLSLVLAPNARALDWESVSEAEVLCRALLNDPAVFLATQTNAVARYWAADAQLSKKGDDQRLRIGDPGAFYQVTIDELRDGDQLRLSCIVDVNRAWMSAQEETVMRNWRQSWAQTVSAQGLFEPYGEMAFAQTNLNARGCQIVSFYIHNDETPSIKTGIYETSQVAGCGGAGPIIASLFAFLPVKK